MIKVTENYINLDAIRLETREEIGTDAAYFAADYHESSMHICDAISERADNETSIYYSDIIKYISDHVEEVNEAIQEFGWDGAGADLYKAGQLAEFLQIEREYTDKAAGIIKYAAIMELIYTHGYSTIPAETWQQIETELEEVDTGDRFSTIADIVTAALEEDDDSETEAATI